MDMDPLGGFNVFGLNTSGNSSSSPESIADDSIDNFSVSLDLDNNMEEEELEEERQQPHVGEINDIDLEGTEQRQEGNDAVINFVDAQAAVAAVEMLEEQAQNEDQMLRFGSSSSDPHPLLVPNIIRDILKTLPLSEVMNCRTVCHQWNEEACRIIQKVRTITFTDNSAITSYLKYYPSPAEEGGSLSRPTHLTYQMYKIDFCASNSALLEFFTAHGSHIQTLILQQSHPVSEKDLYWALENHLPNLETLWLRFIPITVRRLPVRLMDKLNKENRVMHMHMPDYNFPNIKHLTVGTQSFMTRELGLPPGAAIVPIGDGDAGGNGNGEVDVDHDDNLQLQMQNDRPSRGDELTIRSSLVKLLSSLPNLQTLSCSYLDNSCDCFVSLGILRALIQVPRDRLRNLIKLNFPLHVTQPVLEGFNALSFANLSELNIHIGRTVEVPATRQLFQTVGPNLRTLSVSLPNDYPYSRFIRIPGHEMRRLRHLKLSRYRWSLDFLENLTLLERLTCIDMPIAAIFPISIRHEHNLTELRIQGKDYGVKDSEVMSRITRAFPQLRVLHIPGVNDDCLRVIYTDLPYLTDLACTDGDFTDCGISGVSLEVCNDLAETMTYLFVNPDKFRRDLFIGNLTNLTRLRLESQWMSHLSVLFGIVKCSRIEHLYLKSDKLNDAAIESIADQMICSLKTLNVINCPHVSEAGKFFARERIPNLKVYVVGDIVEDPEHLERLKLQSKHAQFDATSRRRARDRDRPDVPRDTHRRRLGFRLLHRAERHHGAPPVVEDPQAGAAAILAMPPPPVQAPGVDLQHFYAMQLHELQHDLNANEAGDLNDFQPDMFRQGLGNFYDDDDDDSSSDGVNEMIFLE